MILNKSQAEAVYNAIRALKDSAGKVRIEFGDVSDLGINVFQDRFGAVNVVNVTRYTATGDREVHADQAAFATAYGL